MKKISGFTLAEVIIVLSVLGIVAALTVPSLIQHQTEVANRTKIKKAIADYDKVIQNIVIAEDIHSDTAMVAWADTKEKNGCKNTSAYFKVAKVSTTAGNGDCVFRTNDGVWWDIDNIMNPTIALKEADLSDLNNKTTFKLVTSYDPNSRAFRSNDLAYESTGENKDDLTKLFNYINNKEEEATADGGCTTSLCIMQNQRDSFPDCPSDCVDSKTCKSCKACGKFYTDKGKTYDYSFMAVPDCGYYNANGQYIGQDSQAGFYHSADDCTETNGKKSCVRYDGCPIQDAISGNLSHCEDSTYTKYTGDTLTELQHCDSVLESDTNNKGKYIGANCSTAKIVQNSDGTVTYTLNNGYYGDTIENCFGNDTYCKYDLTINVGQQGILGIKINGTVYNYDGDALQNGEFPINQLSNDALYKIAQTIYDTEVGKDMVPMLQLYIQSQLGN